MEQKCAWSPLLPSVVIRRVLISSISKLFLTRFDLLEREKGTGTGTGSGPSRDHVEKRVDPIIRAENVSVLQN